MLPCKKIELSSLQNCSGIKSVLSERASVNPDTVSCRTKTATHASESQNA